MFSPNNKTEKHSIIVPHTVDHHNPPPVYLRNGPNPDRKCTDIFCCLIFLCLTGGFGYFMTMAILNGSVATLGYPMDADGNICGVGKAIDYPYVYIVTPDIRYLYRTVCVQECPYDEPATYSLKCLPNSITPDCKAKLSPTDPSQSVQIYNSKRMGQAVCKPTNKELLKQVEPAIYVGYAYSAVHNIQLAGPIILASAGITFTLALIFTCLLTYLTTCVTWIFLVVYLLLTAISGTICFMKATHMYIPFLPQQDEDPTVNQNQSLNPFLLGASIIFGMLFVYALFTVVCNITRIKFMISIIKLATQFVRRNKAILMVPLISFIKVLALIGVCLMASLYVLSSQQYTPGFHALPFQRLVPQQITLAKMGLCLLGLMATRAYIQNFAHYIVASTSALWYLTANENKKSGRSMIWITFKSAIIYHNGSITAGTIYLYFFELIAEVFNLIFDPLRKYRYRSDNQFLHFLTKCIVCCCCCCEKAIMYINKQAYAEVFMLSEGFYASSTAAYHTMHRNHAEFSLVSGLGDSFTHFGKVFLFLVTSVGCWWFMTHQSPWIDIIEKPIYPTIMIALVSLSTSTLFMDMFGQSGDAILLAYFTDIEVEQTHFGKDDCASCPQDIYQTVMHIRQKHRKYYG